MTDPDPERLLAEALRAQAVRAPLPQDMTTEAVTAAAAESSERAGTEAAEQSLPLLSGADDHYRLLAGGESATIDASGGPTVASQTRSVATTALRRRPEPLAVGWIVLLAAMLGLTAGVAIGIITMI